MAYRFNHAICDGAGIAQFLFAVGELARGAALPSIPPVWQRHLLNARHPLNHSENDVVAADTSAGTDTPIHLDKKLLRSFFFSATDISTLRRRLPPYLQNCSKLDVVAACVWRCWTIAVSPKPDEEIRFVCAVDIRKRMKPPLPAGYYGNAVVASSAATTADELSKNPLHYAVELVRKAKSEATDEYVVDQMGMSDQMVASFMVAARLYVLSDLTHAGFDQVDVGWGTAAYGGVAKAVADWIPAQTNWYINFKDEKGDDGIIVPVSLPLDAMELFVRQLHIMKTSGFNKSAL